MGPSIRSRPPGHLSLMNFRTIFHLVSHILLVLAAGMALSAGVGWLMDDARADFETLLWVGNKFRADYGMIALMAGQSVK